jgi:hypothetical protein
MMTKDATRFSVYATCWPLQHKVVRFNSWVRMLRDSYTVS